ncbi:MAG: hypothetical protein LBN21_08775 [Treponema sp.]|jgi:hypothetical protein|nr:hypothetical protein [Treponema sp.]
MFWESSVSKFLVEQAQKEKYMPLEDRLALFDEGNVVTLKTENADSAVRYIVTGKSATCIVISYEETKEVSPFELRTPEETQQELDELANAYQKNY